MGNERMVEIARQYGSERIIIDSSADWGVSDPLAVPKTAALMLERGIPQHVIEDVVYRNALRAYGQSGRSTSHRSIRRPSTSGRYSKKQRAGRRANAESIVQDERVTLAGRM
jgi:hypothetical protein